MSRKSSWWGGWLVAVATVSASAAEPFPKVVDAPPLSPVEQQTKFRLPPGFKVELVAAEPQIHKPMNLSFDARGRLFVTHSLEYPYAAKGEGRDAVTMMEDRDGDGRYETATRVVEKLNIPIGVVPLKDDLIVFSIPHTYRCRDTNGDGIFDEREVLFGPWGYDDTHGMNNGFLRWIDGWIYACHGFRNQSSVVGKDGQRMTLQSGNTYRYREDGSHIEQFTFGQVNPFGICFDPLANLYSADCHSQPMYQLLRGGVYPSFGKPHDGLGFAPTVITHSHGSTGIAGIVYYAADQFPPEYRDTVFIGNPITYRINHDKLQASGASYRGIEQPDFLVCDDPWFRAVDLKLGPDGALYVVDFYNCIIGHYEVPLDHPQRDRTRGRIWKIYYAGTSEKPATLPKIPDLSKFDLASLWQELASPNITRRTLATNQMLDHFGAAAGRFVRDRIASAESATQRAHGVWVLERSGQLGAAEIQRLATDSDRQVRVHLMKALADRGDWKLPGSDLYALVRERLNDDDAWVRRAAAEALGQHPQAANAPALLALWTKTPSEDTHLTHVVRMALRNQLNDASVAAELRQALPTDAELLRRWCEIARGAKNEASAEIILAAITKLGTQAGRLSPFVQHAARYAPASQIDSLANAIVGWTELRAQADALVGLKLGLEERGASWPAALRQPATELARRLVAGKDRDGVLAGVDLVKKLKIEGLLDALREVVDDRSRDEELRSQATEACATGSPEPAVGILVKVLHDAGEKNKVRNAAINALSALNHDLARRALIDALKVVSWQVSLDVAAALARQPAGAESLLLAVEKGQAPALLLQQKNVQQALGAAKLPGLEQRVAKLTAGLVPLDEKLRGVIEQRRNDFAKSTPDIAVGQQAFRKNCGACHRVANEGSKIGPDLDGIGNRGLERILEDVLDPNRTVDPAFRSTTIVTTGGLVLTGLVLREEGDVVILVDGKGMQQRIAKNEIEERKLTTFSPMPANFADQVSPADFYNVLHFLLQQKRTDAPTK